MNSAPPPLPSTENGTDRNSFSRPAAKASAIAPFLAIGLLQLYNLKNQAPRGQLLLLGIDLLACLLIVVGVILGILALICMKSGGRGTIIFRATAGILLSSLLLAIAVPNFLHAREKALAERKMYQQVQSAAKDFQSEAVAAVKEGRSADLSNFKQSLDNAGKNLTGEAAALFRGTSAYLQKLQSLQAAYGSAASDLTNAHVLSSSDLNQRAQLQTRKAVVQKFLSANDAVRTFLKNPEENYRRELAQQQVSAPAMASALGQFRKESAPQMPLLLEIRKTDNRIGESMLSVLALFDTSWGQWQYNSASGKLRFNSTNALQRYNAYLQELDSAKEEQSAAQQKLAALITQNISHR